MSPLEYFFFGIGLVIVLVGVARGYDRELGNTVILQVTVFLFTFFEARIVRILDSIGQNIFGIVGPGLDLFKVLTLTFLFASVVFASYWGVTFDYGGRPLPPPEGTLISIGIGLINAYLIVGMIWYYLDKFAYPVGQWGVILPLSPFAQTLVLFLPPRLFDNPVYWVIPAALAMLLRIRG